MNNKSLQKKTPFIFTKKVNDKFNIIPLNVSSNTLGPVRHFPSATKEWFNSIYLYNSNSTKNLSIADKTLSRLIKSYFNLYFNNKVVKSKYMATRFRRLNMNKVFISRAEIKHTSTKVFITLHVYNQQRIALIRKLKMLESLLFPTTTILSHKGINNKPLSLEKKLNKIVLINEKYKTLPLYWLKKLELFITDEIKLEKDIMSTTGNLVLKKNKILTLENLNKSLKDLSDIIAICKRYPVYYNHYEEIYAESLHKTHLEKEILTIAYYKLLLNLNIFKFEDKFLLKLKPLIGRIYNKEVEFNIINLKTLYLNSDIFTQVIALKLKNRNNKLLRVLRSSLYMVKLPKVNRIRENFYKLNIKGLWVNKVKNLRVNWIIDKYSFLLDNSNKKKDVLNQLLLDLFPSSSFTVKDEEGKPLHINNSNILLNFIFNLLKHKDMAGARLEAKGRLTRRFTASRSVFKIKWKGSLKNIDSSYRGLSSTLLRGHVKSNVQYSLVNSKTRNGAFGLKGWISSK